MPLSLSIYFSIRGVIQAQSVHILQIYCDLFLKLIINRGKFMAILSLNLCINGNIFGLFPFNSPSWWETLPFNQVLFLLIFRKVSLQVAKTWAELNFFKLFPRSLKIGKLFPNVENVHPWQSFTHRKTDTCYKESFHWGTKILSSLLFYLIPL